MVGGEACQRVGLLHPIPALEAEKAMIIPQNRKYLSAWSLAGLLTFSTAVVAVAQVFPPQPPKAQTPLEVQGRHVLQLAGGCGCHGANFAGWREGGPDTFPRALPFGERFVGPFGSIPASNITPDPNTGISGWSDAQLEKLLTEGINPAGRRISPLMPYRAYQGMAKSDVRALIAYLRRLRPVNNTVPDKELKTPIEEPGPFPPAPDERPTEPLALGRYLVHHVSACTDCHSPGGAGPEGEILAGKVLKIGGDSVVAPNLTPDRETGIGSWSKADIARYLRTGSRPDGGLAQSVMAGLILTSFSKMTTEEANAVAAYLKSLPAVHHRPQ